MYYITKNTEGLDFSNLNQGTMASCYDDVPRNKKRIWKNNYKTTTSTKNKLETINYNKHKLIMYNKTIYINSIKILNNRKQQIKVKINNN